MDLRSGFERWKDRTLRGEGVGGFLYVLYGKFAEDECFVRAAAMAYYAIFSLFPLLLVTVAAIGYILPTSAFLPHMEELIHVYIPGSADFLVSNLQDLIEARGQVGVVGVVSLLWISSAVFAIMTRSLNVIWSCADSGSMIRTRIIGIISVLFFGFLGLLSLAISAGLQIFRAYETQLSTELGIMSLSDTVLWRWVPLLLSLAMIFAIFVGFYRFFPARRTSFSEVWPGAALGALAFEVAKDAFITYLGSTPPQRILHGSLTAIVVLMLWLYIGMLIILLGAEFNVMLVERTGGEGSRGSDETEV